MADKDEADPTEESAAGAGHDDPAVDDRGARDGESFSGATAMGAAVTEPEGTPAELADAEPGESTGEDRELVGVGARRAARTGNSAQQGTDLARPERRKKEPEPTNQASEPRSTRTGPVKFVKESVGELRKVVYPTGQQLLNYFVVVLVFVLFVIAFVSLLDLAFGAAIFEIFS